MSLAPDLAPDGSTFLSTNRWLAGRRRGVLITLLLLAFSVRVIAWCELQGTPVPETWRHEQTDMHFFKAWASFVAEVDSLGRKPVHPQHDWHSLVAQAYYHDHPEELGGMSFLDLDLRQRNAAVNQVWWKWYRGTRFHQEPLYPYSLAMVFLVTSEPQAVLLLQMLMGVWTVGLLFGVTRRMFGELAGVIAALLAIGFGPLIHYEMSMLRAGSLAMAGLGLVYLAQRLLEARCVRVISLIGFGVAIGLSITLKVTFAAVGAGLLLGYAWSRRNERPWLRDALFTGAGVLLVLAPVLIRNLVVDAPAFSLSSVGAVTFAGSNHPGYVPSLGWFPFETPDTLADLMTRSGGDLVTTIRETIAQHASFWGFVELQFAKLAQVFHWIELPNNTSFYYSCLHSKVLTVQRHLVAVWWLFPLGLAGLGFAIGRRRRLGASGVGPGLWSLVWLLLLNLAPMIVFYVLSRFRLPFTIAMMPLAAYGLLQLAAAVARRRVVTVLVAGVLVASLAVLMNRPPDPRLPPVSTGLYLRAWTYHYEPLVVAAVEDDDKAMARDLLTQFFDHEPAGVRDYGSTRIPRSKAELETVDCFLRVYRTASTVYGRLGDRAESEAYGELARRLASAASAVRHPGDRK